MLMPICSGVRGTPALWIQKQSRVAGAVVFGLLVVVEYTTVLRCLFSQLCNGFHMRMRYDYALSCRSDRMFCITITVINGLVCALCRLTHRPLHSAEQSLVRCPVLVRNLTVLGRGSPSERDLEERGGARKELTAVPVWFGQARSPSPEGEVASGRSLSESDPPLQAATRGL
uniref:Uncharacterized protein n=1 Tax=Aegilops tauschii subsp. strangulata TaxID=200361 RepID=A0A453GT16_AEGTS